MESNVLRRAITPMLYRHPGSHHALELAMESMPVEALRDLLRLLQNAEEAVRRAERTFRPFPGGPKIRL
jgi:hypothetical protein